MLKQAPLFFNLHTLNVWRPEVKNLMVRTHEVFNGERSRYESADLHLHTDLEEKPYTSQGLLASLADGSVRRFRFHRQNAIGVAFSVVVDGHVVGAFKATPTAWVLTVQGEMVGYKLSDGDCVAVTIVCFYETGDYGCNGRGFGMIPYLPLAQLGY